MTEINPLRRYRTQADRSLDAVGRELGVHKSTILRWEERRVPAQRVLDVERATGVPRHELRPDLYPPPDNSTLCGEAVSHHDTVADGVS